MNKALIRRMFSGLFAVSLSVSALTLTAYADEVTPLTPEDQEVTTFDDGILTYTIIDDSKFVEITGCEATATHVNIMPKIDGYTVTAIAEGAFAGCSAMQSITIPKNSEITSIGNYAFADCSSLKSVDIPDTITEIPAGAFAYCTSLETVTLSDNITYIGNEAFRECSSLTEIKLPDSLEATGGYVFYMCSSLENITFPENLVSMDAYSFTGCVKLNGLTIPAALEDLGDAPFLGCMALTDITVDEANISYTVKDGILFSKDETVLYFYPPSRTDNSYTVPENVIDIYDGAFFQCQNLEAVILPNGLLTIGGGAFDFCSSLKSVTIPESVVNIMSTAFADCTSLESVTFAGADNETEGEGAELAIGDHAFYACESLPEVVLPKRVSYIGEYAFGVTDITDASGNPIPSSVDGFMLKGFEAAEKYARDCELNVGFSPRHFPWKKVVFWTVAAAVLIVIVFFAAKIVKKNMMTPEEKEALRQAKEEARKAAEAEAKEDADDGYKSILGDDESEHEETDEEREAREAAEMNRFRSAAPSVLHHRGHSHGDNSDNV
ncbi:MAG: leucine-rich repeat domain-containing protein [Ruminococcus sp.]|nr:leucine-rich repeat domain-containing protein [Ruminococcus sp.]